MKNPPPSSVRVLAAVVCRNGALLLCRRPHHKRHGGLWEFPGGKVEPGESDLEAVRRELAEELEVEVLGVGPVEFRVQDPGSPFVVEFLPVEIAGEPRCLEHEELDWVTPQMASVLELAPADRRFLGYRESGRGLEPVLPPPDPSTPSS